MRTTTEAAPAEVVWYRVPKSRPFIPYSTQFYMRNWKDILDYENTGFGEQTTVCCDRKDIDYYNGARPAGRITGPFPCGSESVWKNGGGPDDPLFTLNADGSSPCCLQGLPIDLRVGLRMAFELRLPPPPLDLRVGLRMQIAYSPPLPPLDLRVGLRMELELGRIPVPLDLRVGLRMTQLPIPPDVRSLCCPVPIPTALRCRILGTGNCDGSYAMAFINTDSGWWLQAIGVGSCEAPDTETLIVFRCELDGGEWVWRLYTNDFANGPYNPSSMTCDPFEVCFDDVDLSFCCTGPSTGQVCIDGVPPPPPCCSDDPPPAGPVDMVVDPPDPGCVVVGGIIPMTLVEECMWAWLSEDGETFWFLQKYSDTEAIIIVLELPEQNAWGIWYTTTFSCTEEFTAAFLMGGSPCVWPNPLTVTPTPA